MTLPDERLMAIRLCHKFLTDISLGRYRRKHIKLEDIADSILRHFPSPLEVHVYIRHIKETDGLKSMGEKK